MTTNCSCGKAAPEDGGREGVCECCSGCAAPVAVRPRGRDVGLDRLRGLAALLMVVDHVALFAGLEPVRMTVGRLAMPLFFVLAGHLVARWSWRLLWVAWLGLVLPLFAGWVDSPNVLLWYAMGAAALLVLRQVDASPWWLIVVALALAANGFGSAGEVDLFGRSSYDPWALFGLLAVGALLPRTAFAWCVRIPRWLAPVGRYPLTVYVGHVLLLTALWT